jgi:UDP-GlcNAc:undecaprenyl-phosphate GlcNAc-1-phosphate transferase
VKVTNLGNLFALGNLYLGLLPIPFTAIAFISICSAYNMVDGIDGLAGGLTLVSVDSLLLLTLGKAPDN